ncbi:uncharacterized protein H6S33_005571 [Morchella sextelata]|uniref:uncharacterized protein n=1 Tax=Morchella sextelata TaxID=1174677 RepID=UPI001D03F728|nr:uncharacterized protein H6S33_005571 [Morchella sextelata]KAH0613685.1 hypothetical protein H6S33_005571 [Morchella sextelata]
MAPRETSEEDIPTPPQVKGWRIFTIAFLACMGACMFGYNLGVIGGCITLPNFHEEFHLPPTGTEEYNFIVANIVSCFQGGTFFGALMGYPLTERFGRIPTLRVASLIFIVGSAMQTWANGSLGLMYAGRFIAGLGIGGTSLLIPLYLSEISPPSIRGLLVGMHEILNQISSCGGFWVNYGTLPLSGSNQWRIPLAIQVVPGGLLFLACFIIPESPRFLIRKERFEEAGKVLGRIRNLPLEHEYLRREFLSIKNQAAMEKIEGTEANANGKGLSRIFGPGDLKRLGVGILMMVAQQCTGVNAMNYYSPSIFKSIGFGGTNVTLFATGIYAIVKSIATLLSLMFFIDRTGRRKLLFIGAGGASLSMWYIGAYIIAAKVDPDHPQNRNAAAWIGIVMVYIYAMFFSIAWNAIPWIYCSEIFPGRIRALCVSVTTATQWLGQFVIARATPYMISNIGGGTYMFFASCMVVIIGWVYFFVPETKGRTLESMDELFGVDRTVAAVRAQAKVDEMNEKKETEVEKKMEAMEVV